MKTVLVHSPLMGYTGSEMAIRNLILHGKRIRYIILSGKKGELLSAFPSKIPTYHIEISLWQNRLDRIYRKLGIRSIAERKFQKIVEEYRPDLVLLNTIHPSQIIMKALRHSTVPFAVYVHELPYAYQYVPQGSLPFLLENARGIIACSEAAAEPIRKMGVKKVFTFHETIDTTCITISEELLCNIRTRYGAYDHIFVMSGLPLYGKGLHLVPTIASFLRSKNAAFLWLGDNHSWSSGLMDYVERVKSHEGLDNLFFAGLQKATSYYTYLSLASAFLLMSIADSYPLVMLEAAYLRKPIIAFRSGGVAEFVKEGMGRVVPLLDIDAFLESITDFLEGRMKIDPELLHEEAKKHDTASRVDEFEDLLLSFL